MRLSRLLTPLILVIITLAIVGLPFERTRNIAVVIQFIVPFLATVAIFGIVAIGLNIQFGYSGIINFGVVGFFMVGAYTAAIFTKPPPDSAFVVYVGGFGEKLAFLPFLDSAQWLPFLIGSLVAGGLAALLALLLAGPALRLREDYLAITTIGVAEVLRRIVIEERWLVNGTRGLTGIPQPLAGWFAPSEYPFVFLAITVGTLGLIYLLVERGIRSPWGRVLRALREDEDVTAASGKNVFRFKMQAFVLGAFIMGLGGALYAFQSATISPEAFTHFFGTFIIWAMLIVGGSGNNRGAMVGAFIVWSFWAITLQLQGYLLPDVLAARIFYLRDFLIGALIVTVLLLKPKGLLPEQARVSRWLERSLAQIRRDDRSVSSVGQPGARG
jgi:branched-chain amino acid transport system permease protein